MKTGLVFFSLLIASLLVLFQLAKYTTLVGAADGEWWLAVVAVIFFILGIRFSIRLTQFPKRTKPVTNGSSAGLSPRESEILGQLAEGLSNKEIAGRLFLSENTVKKHVSSIFMKLNAKRRTDALKRARELELLDE